MVKRLSAAFQASAEEHRMHLSLHNINSAKAKGEQYFLPGVHSDIGGGYLDAGSDASLPWNTIRLASDPASR